MVDITNHLKIGHNVFYNFFVENKKKFDLSIIAIHDQGAGGNGNVLKELVEPEGAVVFSEEFQLGDPTITTLELWGAEYQENDALLCTKENRHILEGDHLTYLILLP